MTFNVAQFRQTLPEFTNTEKYPDSLITGWGNIATLQVDPKRWKNQTQLGINLYTAHEITLEMQGISTAAIGGAPSGPTGVTSSKTVGSVTVQYDTQQAAEKDAGWWNLTTYGKQFIRLARIYGAGVVQM